MFILKARSAETETDRAEHRRNIQLGGSAVVLFSEGTMKKGIWLEWQLILERVTEFVDCNTQEKPNQEEKGRLEKRETLRKPIITNSQANGPSRHTTT